MKHRTFILLIVLILSLTACSKETLTPAIPPASETITQLDEGVWPVNEYTAGLPVPSGTVQWAMLDHAHPNCSIHLTDCSETAYRHYMNLLQQAGYSVVEEVSESISEQGDRSMNTLLSNGEKGLSISYLSNAVTIYIAFE